MSMLPPYHEKIMNQVLSLAKKGGDAVRPNPLVGCILVNRGKIVGKGFHKAFGKPHAEIEALKGAGASAKGAEAYVNLEPCNHWGKTPPCAPELIRSGVKTVFIAMKDPNPKVRGGIRALKKAGLRVQLGLLEESAKAINRPFITWITQNRPYVILKMAMTLDGKIATSQGHSKWITDKPARKWVHQLRSRCDAVLIGSRTASQDNPVLTSHGWGKNPIRVLLDPHLKTKLNHHLFQIDQSPTVVVTKPKIPPQINRILEEKGVQILRESLKNGFFDLRKTLKKLSKFFIYQILVEGGGETAWQFIKHSLVDEVFIFIAPKIVGGANSLTPVEGEGFDSLKKSLKLGHISVNKIGHDILIHGIVSKN